MDMNNTASSSIVINDVSIKRCCKCHRDLSTAEFTQKTYTKDRLSCSCRQCEAEYRQHFEQTRHGFLRGLIGSTQSASKTRGKKGRAVGHSLTIEHVKARLLEQQDTCYLSQVPLNFKRFSNWKCSLERLDNAEDYSDANCRPIAHEFQTVNQWTPAKIQYAFTHQESVADEELQERLTRMRVAPTRKGKGAQHNREHRTVGGVKQYKCATCAAWRFHGDPDTCNGKDTKCRICYIKKRKLQSLSWRRVFFELAGSSHKSTKTRTSRKRVRIMCPSQITPQVLFDMYKEQKGVCAYSGIPLTCDGDWKASLERIDTDTGYTRSNCLLVCQEFNSSVYVQQNGDSSTGGFWNTSKYAYVRQLYSNQLTESMQT
jgi:hypothetical protein